MNFTLEDKETNYYKDQLTGLDNRFALMDYLKRNSDVNIFLLNLDNFSSINDTYGYQVGDEVIVEVCRLLCEIKFNEAKLFRFDGDEFVFIVEDVFNTKELEEFSESIIAFFNQIEIDLEHHNIVLKISPSIGVAIGSGTIALNHAKVAINELRVHSRNAYKIFSDKSDFAKKQQDNVYWINKIRNAISNEKLFSFFQPILNTTTNKIEKFECLARIDEDNVIISPARFMEASRITGTQPFITRTIISNAFKEFSNNNYEFSINITRSDIHEGYLENFLLFNSNKYGIDPSRVVLELLEDIGTLTESNMLNQIDSLRALGFKVAIDDFGQKNSNFSRLLELNPDYLKIDGAFIKNILDNDQSMIIVEAIIDICKKSGIEVIAEFVHNEKIFNKVVEMGVNYVQGYYIGKPMEGVKSI